jgi:uncharacterized DUF497 family protein
MACPTARMPSSLTRPRASQKLPLTLFSVSEYNYHMYDDVIYMGRYIWNKRKAELNIQNHNGINFENAVKVFEDPYNIEEYFTLRGEFYRIFSAREADGEEIGAYYENVRACTGER